MNGAMTPYNNTSGSNGLDGANLQEETFKSPQVEQDRLGPKKIIICCDGTWQDSETLGSASTVCPTNVARLSNVLARGGQDEFGNTWPQVVYYQSGVGTGQEDVASKMVQGGIGVGLLENVIRAYNFIVNNYNDNKDHDKCDKLYMFGFSRGAYTARALAGLVCGIGILSPTAMPEFRRQYFNYIRGRNFRTPFQNTASWKNFIGMGEGRVICKDPKIDVVGVWDTVGALGIPDLGHIWRVDLSILRRAFQFYDTELHENILHAFHALALDECRDSFKPTLWTKRPENKTELVQCWFPGAHVNVGGGMQFEADETLAYVSYAWMLDRIRPYVAVDDAILKQQMTEMYFAAELRTKYRLQSQGFVKDGLNYLKAFILGPTALPVTEGIDPVAAPIDRMTDWMFNFMTWNTARSPNQSLTTDGGETCEYIHPSAICRYIYSVEHAQLTYIPAALRHWTWVYEEKRPKDDSEKDSSESDEWVPVKQFENPNSYPRRARWYKYKQDFLGRPIRNGRNEFIVENYIDEYPRPQYHGQDIIPSDKSNTFMDSIEGWLFSKSWSHLYYGKIPNIAFTPGLFDLLPTGLHSIIAPEVYRYLGTVIPPALLQQQAATQIPMLNRPNHLLLANGPGDVDQARPSETAKPKKSGKKNNKGALDDMLPAPVAIS